jgi:hypothetical protein
MCEHNPALPLLCERTKREKPMITLRKSTVASTFVRSVDARTPQWICWEMFLRTNYPFISVNYPLRDASTRKAHRKQGARTRDAGRGPKVKPKAKVPISVKRFETPDGPGVIAIIGEFPSDLDEGPAGLPGARVLPARCRGRAVARQPG